MDDRDACARRARDARCEWDPSFDLGRPFVRRPSASRARGARPGASRARSVARPRDPAPTARRLRLCGARAFRSILRISRGSDHHASRDGRSDATRVPRGGDAGASRAPPRWALSDALLPERGRHDVRGALHTTAAGREPARPDPAAARRRVRARARRTGRRVPPRARRPDRDRRGARRAHGLLGRVRRDC